MALLKKTTKEKKPKGVKTVKESSAVAIRGSVIKNPRITEKASMLAEFNAYTFDINPRSNKREVSKAIQSMYKVIPLKIRIITQKSVKVAKRGTRGKSAAGKKAMVYLKKEDKIELI